MRTGQVGVAGSRIGFSLAPGRPPEAIAAAATYKDLAGQVAGAGGPAGAELQAKIGLAGAIDGQSVQAGDATLVDPLAGNQAGSSALTGALVLVDPLAGDVGGSSALQGNLSTLDVLEGTVAGGSTLAGDLTLEALSYVELAGQIDGTSAQTGDVAPVTPLAGAIAGASTQTAPDPLTVLRAIAGELAGAGGPADVELQAKIGLAGQIAGTGELDATLVTGFPPGPAYRGSSLQGAHRAPSAPAYRKD